MSIEPADALVAGCVLALAIGDVQLHRYGRRLVTDALRRPVVTVGLVALTLHTVDVLGPLDPFRLAASLIPRRCPCPCDSLTSPSAIAPTSTG